MWGNKFLNLPCNNVLYIMCWSFCRLFIDPEHFHPWTKWLYISWRFQCRNGISLVLHEIYFYTLLYIYIYLWTHPLYWWKNGVAQAISYSENGATLWCGFEWVFKPVFSCFPEIFLKCSHIFLHCTPLLLIIVQIFFCKPLN